MEFDEFEEYHVAAVPDDDGTERDAETASTGECAICHADTMLRCAPCGTYLCHFHPRCPNGCDDAQHTPDA